MGFEAKTLAILRILEILERYSDKDHLLTHFDIIDKLDCDYGIEIERKTVGRHLSSLKEAGYNIETIKGKGSYIESRNFDEFEVKVLMDLVKSNGELDRSVSNDLIKKLERMESVYAVKKSKLNYQPDTYKSGDLKEIYSFLKTIEQAIEKGKQLEFTYNCYGTDKALHPSNQVNLSPIKVTMKEGAYYLLGIINNYRKPYEYHWLREKDPAKIIGKPSVFRLSMISKMYIIEKKTDFEKWDANLDKNTKEFFLNRRWTKWTYPIYYWDEDPRCLCQFICKNDDLDLVFDLFGKENVSLRNPVGFTSEIFHKMGDLESFKYLDLDNYCADLVYVLVKATWEEMCMIKIFAEFPVVILEPSGYAEKINAFDDLYDDWDFESICRFFNPNWD